MLSTMLEAQDWRWLAGRGSSGAKKGPLRSGAKYDTFDGPDCIIIQNCKKLPFLHFLKFQQGTSTKTRKSVYLAGQRFNAFL